MDIDSSSDDDDSDAPQALSIRIPIGHRPVIFPVPGSHDLTVRVLSYLGWQKGLCSFQEFENGEISARVEETVTNQDVFVLYTRDDSARELNFSLVQLLLFVAALRSETPYRITVMLPCMDYARQDRRLRAGEGIPPQLMLRLLKGAGADRFVTTDLHNEAVAAFTPGTMVLDQLSSILYLAQFCRSEVAQFDPENAVVCATNGGGMAMTRRMAAELKTGFVMADRIRGAESAKGQVKIIAHSAIDHLDTFVIVDDMFDTCGSLAEVCKELHKAAPRARIYGLATHGYFSARSHEVVKELVEGHGLQWVAVTNSVNQAGAMARFEGVGMAGRLKVVDISKLLAGAVGRIHLGASVGLPKFRQLGPDDYDAILQPRSSEGFVLGRRHTDDVGDGGGIPPPSPYGRR